MKKTFKTALVVLASLALALGGSTPAMALGTSTLIASGQSSMAAPAAWTDPNNSNHVYVSWDSGTDALGSSVPVWNTKQSTDGGTTWSSVTGRNFAATLRNGSDIINLDRANSSNVLSLWVNGTASTGTVSLGTESLDSGSTLIFATRVIKIGSTFYATAYGRLARVTESNSSILLMSSTDGLNWTRVSTIADPSYVSSLGGYLTYTEPTVEQLPNGKLFVVYRAEVFNNGMTTRLDHWNMRFSATTNALSSTTFGGVGVGWDAPALVYGSGAGWADFYARPTLMRSGNSLYLTMGRLDNYVWRAPAYLSGSGLPDWQTSTLVYRNRGSVVNTHGSSANSSIAITHGGTMVSVFVDRTGYPWGHSTPGETFEDTSFPGIKKVNLW